MPIPKKLKIGPHTYKVHYPEVVPLTESGKELNARIDYDDHLMYIRSGLPAASRAEGLLHEVIHGIVHDRDIDVDETDVEQMARGWLAFIIDNPKIMGTKFMDIWKE